VHWVLALSGSYCNQHPNAGNCSGNSFPAELIGGLIIALPIVLWLLTRLWRRSDPDVSRQSRPARIVNRAVTALSRTRTPK
jgi:hypothetical protein